MKNPFLIPLLLFASLGTTASSFSQTPAPSPSPTPDQSVTFQNNVRHDGNDPISPLVPPLTLGWKNDLTSSGVTSISYPLIAHGRVIVTTSNNSGNKSVTAFDETNGKQLWSASMSGTYDFINAAYDAEKVFVINFDGLMRALDAASGTLIWSVQLPGKYACSSPPTAVDGLVFVDGGGVGGTLYAVDENNGNFVWTMPVEYGGDSSPAVDSGRVFVSYAFLQSYAFATGDGQPLWTDSDPHPRGAVAQRLSFISGKSTPGLRPPTPMARPTVRSWTKTPVRIWVASIPTRRRPSAAMSGSICNQELFAGSILRLGMCSGALLVMAT